MGSHSVNRRRILIVGYGAMGRALVASWKAEHDIIAVDPGQPECLASFDEVNGEFDLFIIAIKPQLLSQCLPLYQEKVKAKIWITVAAGMRFSFYRYYTSQPFIRVMPNLATQIQEGVCGLYSDQAIEPWVIELFEQLGLAQVVEREEELETITALSGSGPAYFYAAVESLAKAGEAFGLTASQAYEIAARTFIGAASMLKKGPQKAWELRAQVTSPQGTTEAALSILMDSKEGLDALFQKAVEKALKRSKELSEKI